jgi:hypothetical protein
VARIKGRPAFRRCNIKVLGCGESRNVPRMHAKERPNLR